MKIPTTTMVERPPTQTPQTKMAPGPAPVAHATLTQASGAAVGEAKAEVVEAEGTALEGANTGLQPRTTARVPAHSCGSAGA